MNFNTKTKLLLIPVVFVLMLVITFFIYTSENNTYKQRDSSAKTTDLLIQQVLKGRITVYQFLRAPNEANANKVREAFSSLNSQVEVLIPKLSQEENKQLALNIIKSSKGYIKYFDMFAQKRINDFNKGIQKESAELKKIISQMVQEGLKLEDYLAQINKSALDLKEETSNSLNTSLLVIALIAMVIFITISTLILKSIISSLDSFQNGLLSFFKYLNHETKDVELMDNKSNDEFGQMAALVNNNIENIKSSIDQDRVLMDEIVKILSEYEKGDFSHKITKTSSNETLNDLVKVINKMSGNLEDNIEKILDVLDSFSNFDYRAKVSAEGIKADLEKLALGVNSLGENISEIGRASCRERVCMFV